MSENVHPGTTVARRAAAAFLVALCAALTFGAALRHGFVWDDLDAIGGLGARPALADLPGRLVDYLWGPATGGYFRPLIGFITTAVHAVAGEGPAGFHAVTLACHVGVSVLAFLVLNRILARTDMTDDTTHLVVAGIGAVAFSVHPVHAESVAWVSGITDPAYSFFFLLGLLSFQLFREGAAPRGLFYAVTASCCLLSPLAKEPGVMLPLALVTYDLAFPDGVDPAALVRRHLPFAAATACYFLLRIHALSGLNVGGTGQALRIEDGGTLDGILYLANMLPLFARYLGTLVVPYGLSAYYPPTPVFTLAAPQILAGAVVAAAYALALGIAWRRSRPCFFALAVIVIPLLPALHFRATGTTTFADRYLYLPVFGFATLVVFAAAWLLRRYPLRRGAVLTAGAALVAIWGAAAVGRTLIWENNFTLWSDVVATYPDSAVARYNLAYEEKRRGNREEALRQYREALRLNPRLADAHMNIGNLYAGYGMFAAAISEYQATLALRPDHPEALYNMGRALLDAGRAADAIAPLRRCLAVAPGHTAARRSLEMAEAGAPP